MVSKKTKRARLNPGELVYTFYFKLQHNSIISPEYSDGNDDAYDVTYYSYSCIFRDANIIKKFILKNLVNGDLLITMGAGNIVEIGENLLNN